ncbi:MAG: glycoside hydrolase family 65 protein [Geodermatophilaceae bacterium]|nr:glycoside hydrolase family 65 protein [Geodermatophilaceae bacterium]
MTDRPEFPIEPWALRETSLKREALAVTESVFALANGHIGMRGTLDEGEPRSVPGTYLNGFYEERPLPHAEAGYGFPESGQTVVNVTDGKLIRLLVVDSPLDLNYGTVLSHERVLDLRSGLLVRRTDWTSPNGHSVRVTSQRLVSFTRRSVAAICYEVEPLDADLYVAVQSDLLANEPLTDGLPSDPRAAAALRSPLQAELADSGNLGAVLVHRTDRSRLRMAAGMDHTYDVPEKVETSLESAGDLARLTIAARLPKGTQLRLVKFLAYGWSSRRSASALRDQVEGGLATAKLAGWDILAQEQREFLDEHWRNADVEIDGDPELQQAVRVAMFHVLQAGVRAEQQPIPAKGLTGPGYDGHTFWDSETFVLPVLTYTAPEAVRDALQWRHSILDMARERAQLLRQAGAVFPWRTIHGEECSGYWPAGTAAFHLNADIADATIRYLNATGDEDFDAAYGAELLIETARLWASLGHFNGDDRFRITGVTGPDEYTAVVDDNLFTNLMAQRNLREGAAAAKRQPEVADRLEVTDDEIDRWQRAAEAMLQPYDEELGVHPQSQGFTHHAEWDFEGTPRASYPLLLHFPYFEIYRKQVIKQADLVLAMHLRGDAFTAEEKTRNFAYYEARTVRDSSLSAATQAVIAAEVGQMDLAYDYWAEAALGDLHNLHHNSGQGLHIASLAGAWTCAVAGFGGMRDHDGRLSFAPRLPSALSRLRFRLLFRGRSLRVEVGQSEAQYVLAGGEPLVISHHGEEITVAVDAPVTRKIPPPPDVEPVHQPPGKAPQRRSSQAERPQDM